MNKMKKKWLICILALIALFCPVRTYATNSGVSLTIVANDNGIKDFGHAFLVITNNGSGSISIGPYVLSSREQVTLGMRENYSGHLAGSGGAYYNVEAASPGVYKSFAYKTISISADDAKKIGQYFQENSYYSNLGHLMFHNCTTFAVRAWNLVAPDKDQLDEDSIDEPWKLKDRIRRTSGARMDTSLLGSVLNKKQSADAVYYLNQNGKVIPYRPVRTQIKAREALSCNQIKLTWTAASDKRIKEQDMITGYKLYYTTNPKGTATVVDISGKNKTSYVLKGLNPNKTYYFKVFTVFKKHGYEVTGDASAIKIATTKNCKVSLNKTKATISMPKTKSLRLIATSTGSHSGSLAKVKWSSSNTKVATVSSRGLVTGKGNGTVYITAKIHGKTAKCKVTVKKPSITLNKKTATLIVGKSFTLKAKVAGTSEKAVYRSSNPKVATVTQSGTVKGKASGTATIRVSVNGASAACKVTVKPSSIRLSASKLSLNTGKTYSLKASVQGKSKKVTWQSSNTSVATVSSEGVVRAKNTGSAVITAKANGKTAKCTVTVTDRLELSTYLGKDISLVKDTFKEHKGPNIYKESRWTNPWDIYWCDGSTVEFYCGKDQTMVEKIILQQDPTYTNLRLSLAGLHYNMTLPETQKVLKSSGWSLAESHLGKGWNDAFYFYTYKKGGYTLELIFHRLPTFELRKITYSR